MTPITLTALLVTLPPADRPPGAVAVSGVARLHDSQYALSPDGTRIAGVASRLLVSPVAGGPPDGIPVPDGFRHRNTSVAWPAGGEPCWIAYGPEGFACLARRPGGGLVAPPDPPAAGDWKLAEAQLAPNGRAVLAVWKAADPAAEPRVELWPFQAGKGSGDLQPVRAVELAAAGARSLQQGRFSGDSSHYLVYNFGQVHAFSLATGKLVWKLEPPDGGGHFRAASSADGKAVAAVLSGRDGRRTTAGVWEGATGEQRCRLPAGPAVGHPDRSSTGPELAVALPGGKQVAVLAYGADGRLGGAVADAATGAVVRPLTPQPTELMYPLRVSVSADGRRLAAAGARGVAIWDLVTGGDARPAGSHRGEVTGAVFSGDGRWVVTIGEDQLVRCWAADSGAERWAIGLPAQATLAGLTPDGKGVLLTQGWHQPGPHKARPRAVRVEDGKPLDLPPALADPAANLVAFSPSGQTVAAVTEDRFRLFSWPAGQPRRDIPFAPLGPAPAKPRTPPAAHRYGMHQVRFSADGAELIVVSPHDKLPGQQGRLSNPCRVERYAVDTGKLLSAVEVTTNHPRLLTAFGRLTYLAVGDEPDPVGAVLADAAGGPAAGRLALPHLANTGMGMPMVAVADARRVLVATRDGVQVFAAADGAHRGVWPPAARPVTALAFSRDGARLVTGDVDGVCVVWDAERHLP